MATEHPTRRPVTIHLTDDQLAGLDTMARTSGRPVPELIESAIDALLQQDRRRAMRAPSPADTRAKRDGE